MNKPAYKSLRPTTYKRLGLVPIKKIASPLYSQGQKIYSNPCHDEQGRFCSTRGGAKDWGKFKPEGGRLNNLVKNGEEWSQNLSPREVSAIKAYTKTHYADINEQLRSGTDYKQKNRISAIDRALSKSFLKEDLVVYRGFQSNSLVEDIKNGKAIGKEFHDKGFLSTTISPTIVNQNFNSFSSIFAEVRLLKGTKAAYVEKISSIPRDKEVLVQRDLKFVITEARKVGQGIFNERYFITLEQR